MKFRALQDHLRKILWKRIEAGELTGVKLARQTGFRQAHISNFLNRKRGLSLEGMDKVLQMQRLSVLDLLDPAEVNKRASIPPPGDGEFENVLRVEGAVAARDALVTADRVLEIVHFKKDFLKKLRTDTEGDRRGWERFVALEVDGHDGMGMYPRLLPGAHALVDRHYNALTPYRKGEQNMYAVRKRDGGCTVRYVEASGRTLVLRPQNPAYPVEVVTLEEGERPSDVIVGRVCAVTVET